MYQVVLSTCPTVECAEHIAQQLVTDKLAACVNILPEIKSIYTWQGKIECSKEVQLIIKTKAALFTELCLRINQLHPYDVPEIIALDITQGDHPYLQWINESLNK